MEGQVCHITLGNGFGDGIVIVAKQTIFDDTIAPIPDVTSLQALNISIHQIDSLRPQQQTTVLVS
jgi:hypothetical protein